MQTFSATYRGERVIELLEDISVPKDTLVLVSIPMRDDEQELHTQLQIAAENVFAKLWDNQDDEVWNEYL